MKGRLQKNEESERKIEMKKLTACLSAALLLCLMTGPALAAPPADVPEAPVASPTEPERPGLPDPNDPDSPDEIIIEEDGVPKVYKKVWDPEQEEYVYILDEDVPLVTSPRTGVTGNGSSAALPAAAVLGLGGLAALAKGKKSAC